jgi:peroxiredoxin
MRHIILTISLAMALALAPTGCGRNEAASVAAASQPPSVAKDPQRTTQPEAEPTSASPVAVGKPAPDWALSGLDGKPVRLSDFRGKKGVLLVFFATWCPYCMEEVPSLIAFQNKYKDAKVELIAVDIGQPANVVKSFAEARKVNYRLVLDMDEKVATAYGVTGIPTNIAIDAAGTIRYMDNPFPRDVDALVKQLEPASGGAAK